MESGLLRVDLSTGKIQREILPHSMFERWVGGSGINDWLLWEHFLKHDIMCDPRSPENVLIFGVGPLAGVGSGIGVKGRLTFKSPCYGSFGDSTGGGKFPYVVRFSGYDYIVVTGKAPKRCISIFVMEKSPSAMRPIYGEKTVRKRIIHSEKSWATTPLKPTPCPLVRRVKIRSVLPAWSRMDGGFMPAAGAVVSWAPRI